MRLVFALMGLLLIAALAAGVAHAGDYYKWTDAHGTVHYSQTPPPPDHASTTVRVSDGAPVAPLPGMANAPVSPEEKTRVQSSQAALDRANKQTLSDDCATAQKNIASLQGRGMVVASGDPDKVRALDPDQRAQALADARNEAATYCAHKP